MVGIRRDIRSLDYGSHTPQVDVSQHDGVRLSVGVLIVLEKAN